MTVAQRIRAFLATTPGRAAALAALGDDDSLIDRGLLDSLGTLELSAWLQEEFGITVDEIDLTADNFESISAISWYVERRVTAVEDPGRRP
ncbi:acyl carrier protein [Saccharothrix obliqua]|uniref:acyl carrier protein n=1 Tax=Saccharothrix obliqua TaxID=2861747 RepID=UPI001C5F6FB8|nr:acyl carrier protein [Saccharothrix obliqua]MBW4718166.1 acyl carrier protein [Saccharothrix obliqua]